MKHRKMTVEEEEKIALQAIKNGYYGKDDEGGIFFLKKGLCIYPNGESKEDDTMYVLSYEDSHPIICVFSSDGGGYYSYMYAEAFDTYGVDWALTKEELEQ